MRTKSIKSHPRPRAESDTLSLQITLEWRVDHTNICSEHYEFWMISPFIILIVQRACNNPRSGPRASIFCRFTPQDFRGFPQVDWWNHSTCFFCFAFSIPPLIWVWGSHHHYWRQNAMFGVCGVRWAWFALIAFYNLIYFTQTALKS